MKRLAVNQFGYGYVLWSNPWAYKTRDLSVLTLKITQWKNSTIYSVPASKSQKDNCTGVWAKMKTSSLFLWLWWRKLIVLTGGNCLEKIRWQLWWKHLLCKNWPKSLAPLNVSVTRLIISFAKKKHKKQYSWKIYLLTWWWYQLRFYNHKGASKDD